MAALSHRAAATIPVASSLRRPNSRRRAGTALPSFNTRLRASSADCSSSSSNGISSKAAEDQATVAECGRRRRRRNHTEAEEQEKEMELAEELESMEEEALMTAGADQGRDPLDYNRRAHLFDQSSRVFQALKHRSDEAHH